MVANLVDRSVKDLVVVMIERGRCPGVGQEAGELRQPFVHPHDLHQHRCKLKQALQSSIGDGVNLG